MTSADELLTESGEDVRILGVNRQILDEPVNVYNITVDEVESEDYHTYYVGSDSVLVHNACSTSTKTETSKPTEKHHFLTDKNKKWTPEFKKITDKYGLDLNKPYNGVDWNIKEMAHRGRHATEYHKYMLDQVTNIDKLANGNTNKFIKLFKKVTDYVEKNPDMLYKAFWKF